MQWTHSVSERASSDVVHRQECHRGRASQISDSIYPRCTYVEAAPRQVTKLVH